MGIAAALIATGPGVAGRGVIDPTYVTVMDLAPTFIEIAGAKYPNDESLSPMLGESVKSFRAGEADTVHDEHYVTAMSHSGRAYLRQGDWRISNLDKPFDESKFKLFDLKADPGETNNLADEEAEKLEELIGLWRVERKKLGIILPEDL
jgi:arylsulfatase A-like enzyme